MALNPITFTEQVVDDFLRYQLTTYPLADSQLYAQLRALLRLEETRSTPLRKGPFVSLSRAFRQGASVAELVKDGVFHSNMANIVPYSHVRSHQEQAIRSIHEGFTTLVSTGTGSGKTESFLYPIISRCLELQEQNAPPGILAVIFYPMNALAEDQLDRLRALLAGRGVSFGMYVGKTPESEDLVTGERMPSGTTNAAYLKRLQQIRGDGQTTTLLPPEERTSRSAMRAPGGQPRILLTNVKQLELLLTRGKDVGMFNDALLEYLVFDEAHTFRGAQGAETACLIRRLRTFCGKKPNDVRHIATSATMADPNGGDGAARNFARRFFGVDDTRVRLVREVFADETWNEKRSVPAGPPTDPHRLLNEILSAVDAPDIEVADRISRALIELGGARLPRENWQASLNSQLSSNELVFALSGLISRPQPLGELPALLKEKVGRTVPETEILAWLALGAATGRGGLDPLLRPVVHSFVRGVGGAVVTFSDNDDRARLWLSGADAAEQLGDSHWKFPLITCTTCGQHYYENWAADFSLHQKEKSAPTGGQRHEHGRYWEHVAAELGGSRMLLVDRLIGEPDNEESIDDADENDAADSGAADLSGSKRLHPVYVCTHCGSVHDTHRSTCAACNQPDTLMQLHAVRTKSDQPGVLKSCVACQTPARYVGGRLREPARPVRAVSVSDVHVLAQSMMHLSERPRLLVFADNRQDAAFQAGWMRDHARRFRLRTLVAQQIATGRSSLSDIVHGLDDLMAQDTELSAALLPEVWRAVPFEDNSTKHAEERRYFLRIHLIRELATSTRQRLGLEPWGRIRVSYSGIDEALPFVQSWAERLGLVPAELADGIAAMLDHLRRSRLLYDSATRIYSKFWLDGDKEIQYGYLPRQVGGPRGLKLTRESGDLPARAMQWLGSRPTQMSQAISNWGLSPDDASAFIRELFAELVEREVLVPVELKGRKNTLPGSAGVHQINSSKILLHAHVGRLRCEKCRRTAIYTPPGAICLAWQCGGKLRPEAEQDDDFDLRLLDNDYTMLRVAEHSAQVPSDRRERIENQFKGSGEQLNTLVCTPTLELGVDIGSLDAVLMRNVPPTAANYWQRAGRAGRRHRMAVDITYAQATGFDQAYFRAPLKLLHGLVEPPRFNLRNSVMIRKHVHATALTALLQLGHRSSTSSQADIDRALRTCFPKTIADYLFGKDGKILAEPVQTTSLHEVIAANETHLLQTIQMVFTIAWPAEDLEHVTGPQLRDFLLAMPFQLQQVIARFKRRLNWAMSEMERLAAIKREQGVLDIEDAAHERRCHKIVQKLKGQTRMTRASAQGGADDAETMGALAREGFLPGYGLEAGSILGTAETPRMNAELDNFELPRAPSMALREYVPGNAIYANGFRFVPRKYQLTPDETLRFRVNTQQQVIHQLGVETAQSSLADSELRAVPICDVTMPSQSQISDEEDFRFQMSVAVYGQEIGFHRGGKRFSWAQLDLRLRHSVSLRLVNVGPKSEVNQSRLGYHVCLACGQSHSPFSSDSSRVEFEKHHLECCRHRVQPTGFFADVEVDVLGLHMVADRKVAFSVAEALRMGAARVLEMEVEDLQLLPIGHEESDACDLLIYDPMPGGSGLLAQLTERWNEVRDAAIELLQDCPSACETACIDCMHTYRNRFYHAFLDRHTALEILTSDENPLVLVNVIPEHLKPTASTTGQAQTPLEARFLDLLRAAGMPEPICQHAIEIGPPFGRTLPDFFYALPEDDDLGLCIYLDGMAGHIHGNAQQQNKDKLIRETLESRQYQVLTVSSEKVDDRDYLVGLIAKVAKLLEGRVRSTELRNNTAWADAIFESAPSPPAQPTLTVIQGGLSSAVNRPENRPLRIVQPTPESKWVDCLPLIPLQIAAGGFSSSQGLATDEFEWAELPDGERASRELFIAQVVGESMNRRIPNGAWCIWRLNPTGTRQGKVVLAQHRDIADPELGGRYTVKIYESQKLESETGEWRHSIVRLRPDSTDPSYTPLEFTADAEGDLQIIAELVKVLGG